MAVCFPAISISPSFLPSSIVVAIHKRRRLKSAVKLGSDGDVTQYVTESRKHWDSFYERHQNKARCGTGDTIFPLAKKFPQIFVHAHDFSHQAVTLVKSHTNFLEDQMSVFVCNIAEE